MPDTSKATSTRLASPQRRPPSMTERVLTEKVLAWLKTCGSRTYARKVHGSAYSKAWADIVGCFNGRMVCIELKRPVDSYGLTAIQNAELEVWRRAGARAFVAYSLGQVQYAWAMIFLGSTQGDNDELAAKLTPDWEPDPADLRELLEAVGHPHYDHA